MAICPNPRPGSEFPLAYPWKLGSDSVPWLCVSSRTPFCCECSDAVGMNHSQQTFTGESRGFFLFSGQLPAVVIESEEVECEIVKVLD